MTYLRLSIGVAQNCKKGVLKVKAQHKLRSEEETEDNKRLYRHAESENGKGMAVSSMKVDGG